MDGNGVLETYKEPPGRITGYPEVTLSNPASFQNQVILENQKRLEGNAEESTGLAVSAAEVFGRNRCVPQRP